MLSGSDGSAESNDPAIRSVGQTIFTPTRGGDAELASRFSPFIS
jgi:hypothetical protein